MTYKVLALKWRPQIFEDLVGQEAVTRTLTNAIQQDRIAHAFLFSGVRGVGKTTTARILAKALNCQSGPTVRPCGECPACREIALGSCLDVLEIDGASNNGVEQVREIVEASRYAPSRDRFKIYIIDEVHMLSTAAFNALLKTLEEPPPTVKFIFATTEYHKIPDTILSRCQEFEFRMVGSERIAAHLSKIAEAEGVLVAEPALGQIARAAEGSLRDGLSALDQVIAATKGEVTEKDVTELLGFIEREVFVKTALAIAGQDTATILATIDQLVAGGRDLKSFTIGLMHFLRDVLVARVAPDSTELVLLSGSSEDLSALAELYSEEDLIRSLDVLTETETNLRTTADPRFHLEMALLKLSQFRKLASFEELLERFESLGGSGSTPPRAGGASKAAPPPSKSMPDRPGRKDKEGPMASVNPALRREPALPSPEVAAPDCTQGVPPLGELGSEDSRPEPPAGPEGHLAGRLIERLRESKPALHALVSRHDSHRLEDDRLTFLFAEGQSVFLDQLERGEWKKLLENQASELGGRKIQVRFEASSPESLPSRESPLEEPPVHGKNGKPAPTFDEDVSRLAEKDPLVRRFVDTFQAEVEEVRSPEPGQDQQDEPADSERIEEGDVK